MPVDIIGRYVRSEGRKRYATGEVVVDGTITARAELLCISERRD